MDWAGPAVFHQGRVLFEKGLVLEAEYRHPIARGTIRYGQGTITCRFKLLPNGASENQCPCYDSQQRWITCAHVVATGLELLKQDARRAWSAGGLTPPNQAPPGRPYLCRETPGTAGAAPARLQLQMPENWVEHWHRTGRVPVACLVEYAGRTQPADAVPTDVPLAFAPQDEAVLFVWEDIAGGPAPGRMDLAASDFLNLLALHAGRHLLHGASGQPVPVMSARVETRVSVGLDWDTGELHLILRGAIPGGRPAAAPDDAVYLVAGRAGWVWQEGAFWPLASVLPAPLQPIYQGKVRIERPAVPRCLQVELDMIARHIPLDLDFDKNLFTIVPAMPRYRLTVRGSLASLSASLNAEYGEISLAAGKPDPAGYFALPDPDNIMGYAVRNLEDEKRALERLAEFGLRGDCGDGLAPLSGLREVRNFLGGVLPELRRIGWRVDFAGSIAEFIEKAEFAMPVVHIHDEPGADWFEVALVYEDGQGHRIPPAEIQRALLKGDAGLEYAGRLILLDTGAIEAVNEIFRDCASRDGSRPGAFRLAGVYTAYVKTALAALDGIDIEAPPGWAARADVQNRAQPPPPLQLGPAMDSLLRPYQKEGLNWLRFLEQCLFSGILADDMGLGKTLQALAWFSLERLHPQTRGKPSLVICPTSLVENWEAEARRFTPGLRTLVINGADRHAHWGDVPACDLVITSYALLRRDVEQYLQYEFAAIVLDEAQHIKNRSTQNAMAAKRLRSMHRLVLTGTPIENSIADLWSIMDFLMPGYLGSYESFRRHYELPSAQPGPEADQARLRLRRKLHPFVLRRLKQEVARELPPKIERLALCTLTSDQQQVYDQYLENSRRRVFSMVSARGFQRARMEILKTLLRLRQVCCHLDLVKLPDAPRDQPSAKLELFMELLDEAVDGGHRVLVFSQFTSMLAILRRRLDERQMAFSYLDGLTKDRLRVVNEFNARRNIPVFLMSLKAGGTGLNLTGADMVIHFDPWWNPAVEAQATDRAHRIGQARTVYMVKLITRGTVEEKVLAMQKRKQAVIDATLQSGTDFAGKLTWEDVQELLA